MGRRQDDRAAHLTERGDRRVRQAVASPADPSASPPSASGRMQRLGQRLSSSELDRVLAVEPSEPGSLSGLVGGEKNPGNRPSPPCCCRERQVMRKQTSR